MTWDPNDPSLLYARGTGKKPGGWIGWVIALLTIGAMLTAWLVTR